jgi:Flp pilus assembly protein TadG
MRRQFSKWSVLRPERENALRGVFLVVGALCLVGCMMFVAYSVDLGLVSMTKAKMQNGTDTAALAAAMEITNAIANAGQDVSDVFTYAEGQARTVAKNVATMNGVYIDETLDVDFGQRKFNTATGAYEINWNAAASQVNSVKVTARRTGNNTSAPDGKLPGMFSSIIGNKGTSLQTESIAYIEPRDMVVVHDFSRSMNFDSQYSDETTNSLTQAQIEANIALIWADLQPLTLGTMTYDPQYYSEQKANTGANATVTFKGKTVDVTTNTKIKSVKLYYSSGGSQTFNISNETTTAGTWQGTGSTYSGKRINKVDLTIRKVGSSSQSWALTTYENSAAKVKAKFGLSGSTPTSTGSWDDYVDFVQTSTGLAEYGKNDMYGGTTYVCWVLVEQPSYSKTPNLWKTRHYPFHAIKEGHELLCDFLDSLGYDDHLGMVSYDTSHRIETQLSGAGMPTVNISSEPITNDYAAVKNLMHYKQAAHYSNSTNMGGGLKDAISLLDNHKRVGSRPAILLMTDGNANTWDSGENGTLPAGWSWSTLCDYDNNGTADYSTSNSYACNVLKYVKQAVDKGYTVHAISVGADADRNLMKAIAHIGDGQWVDVPGGLSASDMEEELKTAFAKIAATVPPARLVTGGN